MTHTVQRPRLPFFEVICGAVSDTDRPAIANILIARDIFSALCSSWQFYYLEFS